MSNSKRDATVLTSPNLDPDVVATSQNVTELDLSKRDLGNKKLVPILRNIPQNITTLDLSDNNLTTEVAAEAFTSIPANVKTLNLSGNLLSGSGKDGDLDNFLQSIPQSVTTLDLSSNALKVRLKAFTHLPANVATLNLSGNFLGYRFYKSDDYLEDLKDNSLGNFLQSIPGTVTTLNLSNNNLHNKSVNALARAFRAIPAGVTTLDLSENGLGNQPAFQLAKAFREIPKNVSTVHYGNDALQKRYDINCLLTSYMAQRTTQYEDSGKEEYFYGSFFSFFQKSFTEKQEAVVALQKALSGEAVDLIKHLPTLRDGTLGNELRAFVQLGMADRLVGGKEVRTLTEFVEALQNQCSPQQLVSV